MGEDLLNPQPIIPHSLDPVYLLNKIGGKNISEEDKNALLNKYYGYEHGARTPETVVGEYQLGESQYDKNITSGYNQEEYRAEQQSVLDRLGNAVPRLVSKTLTEVAKIPGYLGGAVGYIASGDLSKENFASWIDNAYVNSLQAIDDKTKETFQVYTPGHVKNGNLWDNVTSASFWTNEGVDGAGFLLAALAPGAAVKAIGVGAKIAKFLNIADKAGKVSKGIDLGTMTTINTLYESMSEAHNLKQQLDGIYGGKIGVEINPETGKYWTKEEADEKIGEAAKNSFLSNMAILVGPNLLMNANIFGGGLSKPAIKRIVGKDGALLSEIPELTSKQLLTKRLGNMGKLALSEGFWEEGSQFAVENYNKSVALGNQDKDFLYGLADSYLDALTTTEGQKNIFLGAFFGSIAGSVGYNKSQKEEHKYLKNLRNVLDSNFQGFSAKLTDQYKKDKNGKIIVDDNGNPVKDKVKISNAIKSSIKNNNRSEIKNLYLLTNNEDGYKFVSNEEFSDWAYAYLPLDGGFEVMNQHIDILSDKFIEELQSIDGIDRRSLSNDIRNDFKSKAKRLQDIYDKVETKTLKFSKLNYDKQYEPIAAAVTDNIKFALYNESSRQDFYSKRIKELQSELSKLESSDVAIDKSSIKDVNLQISKYNSALNESVSSYNDLLKTTNQQELLNEAISTFEKSQKKQSTEKKKQEKEQKVEAPKVEVPKVAAQEVAVEKGAEDIVVDEDRGKDVIAKLDARYSDKQDLFKSESEELISEIKSNENIHGDLKAQFSLAARLSYNAFKNSIADLVSSEDLDEEHKTLRNAISNFYDKKNLSLKQEVSNDSGNDRHFIPEYEDNNHEDGELLESNLDIATEDGYPFLSQSFHMLIEKDKETGKRKTVYKDGLPVEDSRNDVGIHWEWLNGGKLNIGDRIVYEYEESKTNDLLANNKIPGKISHGSILMVHYIDNNTSNKSYNNRKVIGQLKSSTDENSSLYKLRKSIIEYGNNEETKVKDVFAGRIWSTDVKQNPIDVLNEDNRLVFGIGKNIGGVLGVEVPNESMEYTVHTTGINVTEGAVYMLVPAAGKQIIPVRLFTTKVKDSEKTKSKIIKILQDTNKDNWAEKREELRKLVYVDYNYKNGKFIVFDNGNVIASFTVDEFEDYLGNKHIQVDIISINGGNKDNRNYNQEICNDGILKTDLHPKIFTHSAKVEVEPYSVEKLSDSKSNVVVDDKKLSDSEKKSEVKQPTESDSRKGPVKISGIGIVDVGISTEKTTVVEDKKYPKWNKDEEVEWFKKHLPGVDISVLDNLYEIHKKGGVVAHGIFHNAAVYIWENAIEGTTYHEAFHAVFNLFLTSGERLSLLKEAAVELPNEKLDISKKDVVIKLEEIIAEKFRKYRLSPKEVDASLSSRIREFFKKLYQYLKHYFSNKTSIDEIFYRMEKGFYKNSRPLRREYRKFYDNSTRFLIPEYNPVVLRNRINTCNKLFFDIVNKYRSDNKDTVGGLSDIDIINKVGLPVIYVSIHESIRNVYDTLPQDDPRREHIEIFLNNLIEDVDNGRPIFGKLYYLARRDLLNYGIKVKPLSYKSEDQEEDNFATDITSFTEGWQVDNISKSMKDSLSGKLKILLRTIEIDEVDAMGIKKYADFDTLHNTLLGGLSNIFDTNEMMNKLKEMSLIHPEIGVLLDKLVSDNGLRTDFKVHFTNSHIDFRNVIRKDVGDLVQYNVYSSNRSSIVKHIIELWENNLYNTLANDIIGKDGNIDTERASKYKKQFDTFVAKTKSVKRLTSDDSKELSDILIKFGIEISPNTLSDISNIRNFLVGTNGVAVLVNQMAKGVDVYTSETTSLKKAAKIVSIFNKEIHEDSFINTNGSRINAHIIPNFLFKTVAKLKSDKYNDIIDFYTKTKFFSNSVFFKEMNIAENRENLEVVLVSDSQISDGYDGRVYEDMVEGDIELTNIAMFLNNNASSRYSYFKVPTLADKNRLAYIKLKKYSNSEIIENLYNVVLQEYGRISDCKNEIENLDSSEHIENRNFLLKKDGTRDYKNARGLKYLFLPFMNNFKGDILNQTEVKTEIRKWLESEYSNELDRLNKLQIFGDKYSKLDGRIPDKESFIKNYFYNRVFASIEIIQLADIDLCFFKNAVDFSKRTAAIISPGLYMDTTAEYESVGNKYGVRSEYNTVTLYDNIVESKLIDDIRSALETNGVSEGDIKTITERFKNINQTDAQTYITIDRYREIMIGHNRWTDRHQNAYSNLKEGRPNRKDITLLMQPIKPHQRSNIKNLHNVIIPVQHKNSEFLLLRELTNKSQKLTKLLDYMESNNVDSVSFNSVVKTGLYGAVDFENIDNAVIVSMPNSDYKLQQETPEKFVDHEILIGTQVKVLAFSDMENTPENLEDFKLYNDINIVELEESSDKIISDLNDNGKLREILIESSRNKGLGLKYEESFDLINGEFKLPLFNPILCRSNEEMLNSEIDKAVTKQKIRGGAMYHVSNFGFDDKLDIVIDKSNGTLKYVECYMPWSSMKHFSSFVGKDGMIDISRIPESLKYMVGFKIPTEDSYSILPLKLKGFTSSGLHSGSIMLPTEITKIMGVDFDIDVDYVMMPEFEKTDDGSISKIYYDDAKSPRENNAKARHNKKLDIIFKRTNSKEFFNSFVRGNNANTITDIADKISELEGKNDESLNPILPAVDTEFFMRNIPSLPLRGIFVNYRNAHAILQHDNVLFTDDFIFDGIYKRKFGELLNSNNGNISADLAACVATIVDNTKNPVSDILNLNTLTGDVAATSIALGFSIDTSMAFVAQPILKEFSRRYYNEGGIRTAESTVYNELRRKLLTAGAKASSSYNLSTDDLYKWISESKKDGVKSNAFYSGQLTVLDAFMKYKRLSRSFGKLVAAMSSYRSGAGPTIANNEVFIRNVESVRNDNNLSGINELLSDKSLFPMIYSFYINGIVNPNKALLKHFPFSGALFSRLKDNIEVNLKDRNLSVKEINDINSNILAFISSEYEFYDSSHRDYILNKFPIELYKLKKSDKEFSKIGFIEKLDVKVADKRVPIIRIEFNNATKISSTTRDSMIEDFEYLLYSDKYKDVANKLVQYCYFTNGLSYNINSFSRFIPVSYMHKVHGAYNKRLVNINKMSDFPSNIYDSFVDQFYRNHYKNRNYVPAVNDIKSNVSSEIVSKSGVITGFIINSNDKNLDESLIVSRNEYGIKFSPYISHTVNKRVNLYKLIDVSEDFIATYEIVEKLGLSNYVLEYDINNPALRSSLKVNKLSSSIANADNTKNVTAKNIVPVSVSEVKVGEETKDYILNKLSTERGINFQEEKTTGYRERTIKNASADATIAIAVDFNSAGEKLTKSSVLNQNKKYIPIDANKLEVTQERVDKIVDQLNSVNAKTLNIAGNGIYTMKGKYTQQQVDDFTYDLLNKVLNSSKLNTKIQSIRTGGQTGFDEAGAKAGFKLGISTTILAPKGWTFRNVNGQDISNEQQFKARFVSEQKAKEVKIINHKMYYKMPAKDNLTGKDTTTLELAERGLRTATTRSFPLGKIGDIITFENSPTQYRITEIEKLTKENTSNPEWIKQWSQKEQWTSEWFKNNFGKINTVKIGSYQTTFEKISKKPTYETRINNRAFEQHPQFKTIENKIIEQGLFEGDYRFFNIPLNLTKDQVDELSNELFPFNGAPNENFIKKYSKRILTQKDISDLKLIENKYGGNWNFGDYPISSDEISSDAFKTMFFGYTESEYYNNLSDFIYDYKGNNLKDNISIEDANRFVNDFKLQQVINYNPNQLSLFDDSDRTFKEC